MAAAAAASGHPPGYQHAGVARAVAAAAASVASEPSAPVQDEFEEGQEIEEYNEYVSKYPRGAAHPGIIYHNIDLNLYLAMI